MASFHKFMMVTEIIFGVDSVSTLPEEGKKFGKRVLLVSGKNALKSSGVLDEITSKLKNQGIEVVPFAEVEREPSLATVDRGLALARSERVDWVIGIGGGSAMDAAKAIAGLYHGERTLAEYFDGAQPEKPGIPLITIPTTAGSGAEVTINTVLSDTGRKIKQSIRSPYLTPALAIVDPRLTLTNSPEVTVYAGFDALVQAIEAFTSRYASPLSDSFAYGAIQNIASNLMNVYLNGSNLEARTAVAEGSLMAGIAFNNARLGAVHGLAHAVGIRTGKPHGLVCAVLLIPVIRFNIPVCYEKYARMAAALGHQTVGMDPIDAAAQGIKTLMSLEKKLGIPASVSSLELPETEYAAVAAESLPSGSLKANPRVASLEDLINILKEKF